MTRAALTVILLAVFIALMAWLLPADNSPRYPYPLPTPAWATVTPTVTGYGPATVRCPSTFRHIRIASSSAWRRVHRAASWRMPSYSAPSSTPTRCYRARRTTGSATISLRCAKSP